MRCVSRQRRVGDVMYLLDEVDSTDLRCVAQDEYCRPRPRTATTKTKNSKGNKTFAVVFDLRLNIHIPTRRPGYI